MSDNNPFLDFGHVSGEARDLVLGARQPGVPARKRWPPEAGEGRAVLEWRDALPKAWSVDCKKCGTAAVGAGVHTKFVHDELVLRERGEKHRIEWLERRCTVCGHGWQEKTADHDQPDATRPS